MGGGRGVRRRGATVRFTQARRTVKIKERNDDGEKQVVRRKGETLGGVGGLLRYQVLLTLLALDIFGLGAGHVNICGEGAVFQ